MKNRRQVLAALVLVLAAGAAVAALLLLHRPAALPPEDDPDLVIYSPHPEDMTEYIVREFRQRTGIRTTVIRAGTGELLERMQSADHREEADLFWGGGIESLESATGYFCSVASSEDRMIEKEYRDAHRLWNPFSVLPTVIIYNESLVPTERIPGSWKDLLDPWFRDRIVIADPEKSGSSYTILATMLCALSPPGKGTFGGWDYVGKLAEQLGTCGLVPGSARVYSSVASGDFYAGITFENFALALQKTGSNVGYCYPAEGTSAVPDGIALLKTARHPAAARAFIDFVLGYDVQKLLMDRWQRRSVRTDIGGDAPGKRPWPLIRYPLAEAAASRESILARWAALYGNCRPGIPSGSSR